MALKGIIVSGAGTVVVNGFYGIIRNASEIPQGFSSTCVQMRWDASRMWLQLSDQVTPWYLHENGSYIYYNVGDEQWWIDEPSGAGVYIAPDAGSAGQADVMPDGASTTRIKVPPKGGWKGLKGAKPPLPTVELKH